MKLLLCLFFLYSVTADTNNCPSQCCLNDVLSLTSLMQSMASTITDKLKHDCTNIVERGALANCPEGYTAMSCSCGSACGSYDIRTQNTCHCQCANIDWTSARCCKITSK